MFVYFADHGAVGLVAMPVGDPVYANDLIDALRYMWSNDMYKELVFYMEACESGSMFAGLLPTNVNIYATTAANSEESSYGTYCGDDSSVDGVVIGSCLGDLYSVNFLENSDIPGMFHTESLDAQFTLLKNETDKSHVQKVFKIYAVAVSILPHDSRKLPFGLCAYRRGFFRFAYLDVFSKVWPKTPFSRDTGSLLQSVSHDRVWLKPLPSLLMCCVKLVPMAIFPWNMCKAVHTVFVTCHLLTSRQSFDLGSLCSLPLNSSELSAWVRTPSSGSRVPLTFPRSSRGLAGKRPLLLRSLLQRLVWIQETLNCTLSVTSEAAPPGENLPLLR